ncbi:MAG: Na+/H+ antiporter subunit E [Candidatus Omnitrophica bacterium]|nr:Na+/H+ antiporter subunit E [Candidatus Omnitrophota bacterium]MDD5592234.1 Na+/H+ antiporter subunit E [Candidatus Omnitrophota bacterium]
MIKTRIILFILAWLVYLLLSWSLSLGDLIAGVLLALTVSWLTHDLFIQDPHIFKDLKRYLWFIYYIPLFIWECIKANVDSAYRIVHPALPIRPGIVKVKTTLKSDIGLVFLANTLTLKPGTMTVDIDKENGFLYVHWVEVGSEDMRQATDMVIGKFERILKRIFE